MTEEEWLASADARPMLEFLSVYRPYPRAEWETNYGYPKPDLPFLRGESSDREFGLFALACAEDNPQLSFASQERGYDSVFEYTECSTELVDFIAIYEQMKQGVLNDSSEPYALALWISFACEEQSKQCFR